MKGLSLEVRVGLLILVALVLLGVFVFALGGVDFQDGKTVYVDFDNPGNILVGAPVNIGNIRVGRVESIDFNRGKPDANSVSQRLIRITLSIEDEPFATIHENAMVYVTSTSLVGGSLIAIDPGSVERPLINNGIVLQGTDPPRMDQAFAMGFEVLKEIHALITDHKEEIEGLLVGASGLVGGLNDVVETHRDRIDRIVENVETATDEVNTLLVSANGTINGPHVQRMLRNADRTLGSVSDNIDPLMRDARSATHKIDDALDMVGPEQQRQVQQTVRNVASISEEVNDAAKDVSRVAGYIRQGRGTVGAILMDEEMYDDIQEMLRDLKHNPWKLFWRE